MRALRRYAVLDTPPEAAFDRVARLAARLFHVPIALISLTDAHRHWFKACVGLDLREVGRDMSFCSYTVAGPDVLVVPDATRDPRFAHSVLVTGTSHLRFYAGAPLLSPEGEVLGTLCVMDTVPRAPLSPEECDTLRDLAAGVVAELELRLALNERRRSESLRSAFLTGSLDAAVILNRHGLAEEWNLAAEQLFGYAREEVLGRDIIRLLLPERLHGTTYAGGIARHFLGGEGPVPGRRLEVRLRRRSGQEFPCELSLTPLLLEGEELFTASLRDVTEQRAAREALITGRNLLQAVVDGVPESIFVKDPQGRYVMINAAGAARIGRPVGDILGRDDRALFPAVTAEAAHRRDTHVLTTGETASYEVTDLLPDGSYRTFLSNKSVYRDSQGQIQGLIGTVLDITERKLAEATIHQQNEVLAALVRQRTQEVEQAQLEVLERLARAAELRDDNTGEHVRRVARTAAGLARRLGLAEDEVRLIERAAPLHDVGKIGVPDAVLLKPGRLTPEEFRLVQAHTELGASLLAGDSSRLVSAACEIALTHHERWDGRGYPLGLAGEAIPLSGRIVAVADVLDALTSERPYKPAWTRAEALQEIRAQADAQFDPAVVAALEALLQEEEEEGDGEPGRPPCGSPPSC
ncbi:hypothetical protein Dcar01_01883 [Deinococcus carri]|uniref:Histidine kinase n=1 Tax=Deinococcus carri TaxID=1211323 RepID=A0ABP9WAF2_9DEIO